MGKLRLVGAAVLILAVLAIVYYIGNMGSLISSIYATTTISKVPATTLTTIAATTSIQSSATTVYVSEAPKVIIISPKNLSTVNGNVNISADVTDPVGIKTVQFYIGGNLFATVNSPPYSYVWNTTGLTKPQYTILVKAYDNSNSSGQAQIIVDIGLVQHGK